MKIRTSLRRKCNSDTDLEERNSIRMQARLGAIFWQGETSVHASVERELYGYFALYLTGEPCI
jgi:hypothetical protein